MRVPWKVLAASAAASCALVVGACGGGDDGGSTAGGSTGGGSATSASGEPLVIGAAIGQSGTYEIYDGDTMNTVKIFADEINAKGGINGRPVEFVIADTQSDPANGATAAQEVLSKGAEILLVSCDFEQGSAAAQTGQAAGVLVMSLCAGSEKFGPTGIGNLAFTIGTSATTEGAAAAEWAYNKQGWKTTFTLLDDTIEYDKEFMSSFKTRWKELAGDAGFAGQETFKQGDQSIATQIARIKNANPQPDFIMFCSYQPGSVAKLRQIRSAGINIPILSCEPQEGDYWLDAVPNLKDFYVTHYASMYGDDPDERVNEITKKYKDKYGKDIEVSLAYMGYALMQVLDHAINETGSTNGEELAKYLETLKDFDTVVGPTTFTPESHISKDRTLVVTSVENGKGKFVDKIQPEKVPAPSTSN